MKKEIIKFIVVGGLNTAFSYGIYAALVYLGLPYYSASLLSLIIGIVFSFKTQGKLVFGNQSNRLFWRFVLNWGLIYLCMVGVISGLKKIGVNEYWAGMAALPPIAVLSYITQKFLVFTTHPDRSKQCHLPLMFIIKNYRFFLRRIIFGRNLAKVYYGEYTYGIPLIKWWGEKVNIEIGKFCSIAKNVEIFLGGNHRKDWVSTYPFPAFRTWKGINGIKDYNVTQGDVTIGNDVWIGDGCVILSGVKIGNGAIVGCRSVVTKCVPDYAIVAGNPAKLIGMRFSDEQIRLLNLSAWWDWDKKKIQKSLKEILYSDIDDFIEKALKISTSARITLE